MNLGEIKIESLKLMFANEGVLSTEQIEDLEDDPNYADYMSMMNGSIARAMKRIQTLKKAPCKMSAPLEVVKTEGVCTIDLSQVTDYYKIGSLDLYTRNGIKRQRPFTHLTDNMIVVEDANGTYKIAYYPTLPTFSEVTPNSTEIPLPDEIAILIPFYVKSELLEEEEPSMAAQSRNLFEASLEEIETRPVTIQRTVKRVF